MVKSRAPRRVNYTHTRSIPHPSPPIPTVCRSTTRRGIADKTSTLLPNGRRRRYIAAIIISFILLNHCSAAAAAEHPTAAFSRHISRRLLPHRHPVHLYTYTYTVCTQGTVRAPPPPPREGKRRRRDTFPAETGSIYYYIGSKIDGKMKKNK